MHHGNTYEYNSSSLPIIIFLVLVALTATLANLGLSMAMPAGMMYEKVGLHVTSLMGLILNFTVYLLLWSACSQVTYYMEHKQLLYLYFFLVGKS